MTTKPNWTLSEYFLDGQHKTDTKKSKNRPVLIGILVLVALVVIAGSSAFLFIQLSSSTAEETANVQRPSLVTDASTVLSGSSTTQAYALALISAHEWMEDAALLKASSTWDDGADRESLLSGSETWSFRFYSPAAKQVANLSVINGKVNMINQQSLGTSIVPSPIDGWTIDSDVAILRMLDEGGEQFLADNEVNSLTMALTAGVQAGRPEWLISIFSNGAGSYYNMRLDASNGEILDRFESS